MTNVKDMLAKRKEHYLMLIKFCEGMLEKIDEFEQNNELTEVNKIALENDRFYVRKVIENSKQNMEDAERERRNVSMFV